LLTASREHCESKHAVAKRPDAPGGASGNFVIRQCHYLVFML
jgi:hypothetical protein